MIFTFLGFFKPKWFIVAITFVAMPIAIPLLFFPKFKVRNRILEEADKYLLNNQGTEIRFGLVSLLSTALIFYSLIWQDKVKLIFNENSVWMAGVLSNRNSPVLPFEQIESISIVYGNRYSFNLRITTDQGISATTHNTSKRAVLGLQQFFIEKVKPFNPKVQSICQLKESDCLPNK